MVGQQIQCECGEYQGIVYGNFVIYPQPAICKKCGADCQPKIEEQFKKDVDDMYATIEKMNNSKSNYETKSDSKTTQ